MYNMVSIGRYNLPKQKLFLQVSIYFKNIDQS